MESIPLIKIFTSLLLKLTRLTFVRKSDASSESRAHSRIIRTSLMSETLKGPVMSTIASDSFVNNFGFLILN